MFYAINFTINFYHALTTWMSYCNTHGMGSVSPRTAVVGLVHCRGVVGLFHRKGQGQPTVGVSYVCVVKFVYKWLWCLPRIEDLIIIYSHDYT